MYTITREEASMILNISTRSIDRYIRNWKLRAQKDWKIVYIHQEDIDNFWNKSSKKQEVITKDEVIEIKSNNSWNLKPQVQSQTNEVLNNIYEDLKWQINQKDDEIKKLVLENWKLQEIVKSSISMIEFKKTQFLLEESKNWAITNLENTKKQLEDTFQELNDERKLNYILTFSVIVLILLLIVIWVVKI